MQITYSRYKSSTHQSDNSGKTCRTTRLHTVSLLLRWSGALYDGKVAEFLINNGYHWETVQRSNGDVAANAVIGGTTEKNAVCYIGRAHHNDMWWTSGMIDTVNRCLFVPYDGAEHRKSEYFVLVRSPTNEIELNGADDRPMIMFDDGEKEFSLNYES